MPGPAVAPLLKAALISCCRHWITDDQLPKNVPVPAAKVDFNICIHGFSIRVVLPLTRLNTSIFAWSFRGFSWTFKYLPSASNSEPWQGRTSFQRTLPLHTQPAWVQVGLRRSCWRLVRTTKTEPTGEVLFNNDLTYLTPQRYQQSGFCIWRRCLVCLKRAASATDELLANPPTHVEARPSLAFKFGPSLQGLHNKFTQNLIN